MSNAHRPENVIQLAAEGRLEEWVHDFLRSVGDNLPLSDGLKLQQRYWIGPVMMPLELLQRCYGPEPSMEFVAEKEGWEQHLARMSAALERGWSPPPLIAQFRTDGVFSLRDGNHRHETLRRARVERYWSVIWCDSEELRQQVERLVATMR